MFFEALPPGDYVLAASIGSGGEKVFLGTVPVRYDGGAQSREAAFEAPDARDHLAIRVLDAQGNPRPDARIAAWVKPPGGVQARTLEGRIVLAGGITWLLLPAQASEPQWTAVVAAHVPGLGRAQRDVPLARGLTQDFRLTEVANLVVNFPNLTAGTQSVLDVRVYYEGCPRPLVIGGVTDEQGRVLEQSIQKRSVFADVPVGLCDIVVGFTVGGSFWGACDVVRRQVTVAATGNEVVIILPELASLALRLPPETPGGAFDLHFPEGARLPGTRTGDTVRWSQIPEGDYIIAHATQGEMPVNVRGHSQAAWNPAQVNAILLQRLDIHGVMQAAGFARGDMIVRIDNEVREGSTALTAALAAARKAATVKLEVQRAGAVIVIELEGAKLDMALNGGAWYRFCRH